MPGQRRRRALRWLTGAFTSVVVLPLLLVAVVMWSPVGRDTVRLRALAALQGALVGEVEIERVSQLGINTVTVEGVVLRDPGGATVLSIGRLRAQLSLAAAVRGIVQVERLQAGEAVVDLADFGDRRGLLAAVAAPQSPESPDADDTDDVPIEVLLRQVELDGLSLRAEVPDFGVVVGQHIQARGQLHVKDGVAIEIASMTAQLQRDGGPLAELLELRLRAAGTDLDGAAVLSAGNTGLTVVVSGALPDAAEGILAWPSPGALDHPQTPVQARLELRHADAALLRRFGEAALADSLLRPLDASLAVSGTAAEPHATLSLVVDDAEQLRVSAALDAQQVISATVRASALSLGALWQGLPAQPASGQLSLRGGKPTPDGLAPLSVRGAGLRFGEYPLPEFTASLRASDRLVRDLSLRATGLGGELALTGGAEFGDDGARATGALVLDFDTLSKLPGALRAAARQPATQALHLETEFDFAPGELRAEGQVEVAGLRLSEAKVRALSGRFSLSGDPAAPAVDARLQATGLRVGELAVGRARLSVQGGPTDYSASLSARTGADHVRAEGTLARDSEAVSVRADAHGSLRGRPLRLRVRDVRWHRDGAIHVGELRAALLGTDLVAAGGYDGGRVRGLSLRLSDLDLAVLRETLSLPTPIEGRVELALEGGGDLSAPQLALRARGQHLQVEHRPVADEVTLTGAVKTRAVGSEVTMNLEAGSGDQMALALEASATVPKRRAPWSKRIAEAQFALALELKRITSQYVQHALQADLPRDAVLTGTVRLAGTRAAPVLEAALRSQVRELTSGRDVEAQAEVNYAEGSATARVQVSDIDGRWLGLHASATHPLGTLAAIETDAAQLPAALSWAADLDLEPRPLQQLPFALDPLLAALQVAGHAELTHAPNAEPAGAVALTAGLPAEAVRSRFVEAESSDPKSAPEPCSALPFEFAAQGALAAGELSAQATLEREGRSLADLKATMSLGLGAALASGEAPTLGEAGVEALLSGIELSSLPIICERVQGQLSGEVRGRGLVGAAPHLQAQLALKAFSLDRRHFVAGDISGRIGPALAHVDLTLQHGGQGSRVTGRLPMHIVDGWPQPRTDAPISGEARFSGLPLGAFVPAGGAISRVSGQLDGQLEVAGTLDKPTFDGHLAPRGVGFTATALAQPITDVAGLIAFTNRHVEVARLRARDADGTLSLSGRLDLAEGGPLGFESDFTVEADDFPLRQQGQIAGELDGRARVEASLAGREARVDVSLAKASVWLHGGELRHGLELTPHPDVVDPRTAGTRAPPTTNEAPLSLRLRIDSRDAFWVRRDDFAMRAKLDLTAVTEGETVRVRGPVELDRGYLDLLGQTFELDGTNEIRFVRASPPNPAIQIEASTENRRTGDVVTVSITGRADKPVIRFLIDDQQVTAGEAAQSLLGGPADDRDAQSQAQSMVGSLIGGIMAVTARRELGSALPILMIEPNSREGTRVRAGFELDALVPGFLENVIRGVYVEGILSSGGDAPDSQTQGTQGGVLVELFFPWDLVGSSQYGPGETWSVDLGWQP